ncbi:hypothetical protein GCM10027416_23220 [Okibacterium endophyticum]
MIPEWLSELASTPGVRVNADSGASAEEIAAAEDELGLQFPPSYRAWLLACNDTWIGGGEIFSLAPAEFADDADTDIRYRHRRGEPWQGRLLFYAPSDDERWVFDFTRPVAADGEVAVVAYDLAGREGAPEEYAESFAGFIERRLSEFGP